MLFSSVVERGEVIAFSPQTFLSFEMREKYRDPRWAHQINNTLRLPNTKREAHDLREVIINNHRKVSIYVARDDALDLIHARHVGDCPGVDIHEFDTGGHSLVRELRDQGLLPRIMIGEYA